MAKKSSIERNKKRRAMADRYAGKRNELKAIASDQTRSPEDRFAARMKLAKLPRNSAKVRIRNRCELTGRPRGVYRKFRMSRIAVRDLASTGRIPGMVKSSW
ncbi:MAG: 30S ribosomal protein S14 [Alphaproteobacteria bacterium]|nr:30S ribosomal protein S14 [Alphaproteobacteria bacterium]